MDIDPKTIGLLAASAGFLDPRGGMMGGVASGLGAYAAANQMRSMQATAEMNQRKLLRQLQLENHLQELTQKHGNDPNAFSKALMSSQYPEAIKLGIDLSKARQVKQFLKIRDANGNIVYAPGFNTGEVGESVAPVAEKLMQINRGSQIDLADPYTGQAKKSLAMGIDPGKIAQLVQSDRHFDATHALAQQNSDLSRRRMMMDYDPEYQAQKAGEISGARERAKLKAQAIDALPSAISTFAETLNLSDELKNHPALNSMTGNIVNRSIGSFGAYVGGGKNAEFKAKFEQATGKQFVGSIEAMRGFGALTEKEGDKMQSSAAAMSLATNAKDFRRAQDAYQQALLAGVRKIAMKAGVPEEKAMEMLSLERKKLTPANEESANEEPIYSDGWGGLR